MRRSQHWLFSNARISAGLVRFDEHKVCSVLPHPLARQSNAAAWRPRGLAGLRRKMASYQANGARLGWLLIPHQQAEEVWPASGEVRSVLPCSCSWMRSGRPVTDQAPNPARPTARPSTPPNSSAP